MSCDYAVWHAEARMSNAQAGRLYRALRAGDTSGVTPTPAVSAFYHEITQMHAEPGAAPEHRDGNRELCPWRAAMDRSDGHLIMRCVCARADYAEKVMRKLARKHGLAMYDPQTAEIRYPNDAMPSLLKRLWWNLSEDPSEPRDPWYVDIGVGILFLAVTWFAYFGRADFARGEGHAVLRWVHGTLGGWVAVGVPAALSLCCLFFGARKFARSR